MKRYQEMTKEELLQEKAGLLAEYEKIKAQGLALDMSRGKPGADLHPAAGLFLLVS